MALEVGVASEAAAAPVAVATGEAGAATVVGEDGEETAPEMGQAGELVDVEEADLAAATTEELVAADELVAVELVAVELVAGA